MSKMCSVDGCARNASPKAGFGMCNAHYHRHKAGKPLKGVRPFKICDCGNHAFVVLTLGYVGLVSPEDVALVAKWNWHAKKHGRTVYPRRSFDSGRTCSLHQHIFCVGDGLMVDHISGVGLDNRRENLRECSCAENQRNRRNPPQNTSSKFKGIYFDRTRARWRARITVDGELKYIGSFISEADAARSYDEAAKNYFGEFACLNFEVSQ